MSKILFLDSVAGVAGDMFAAAFVDAGLVAASELAVLPAQLGFNAVEIDVRSVTKATMCATHLSVTSQSESAPHSLSHSHDGHAHEHDGPEHHAHDHHAHGTPPASGSESHLVVDPAADHAHTHYADIDRLIAGSQLAAPVRARAQRIFRLLAEAEAAAHGMPVGDVAFHEVGSIDSIVDVVMAAYCIEKLGPVRCCATPIRPGRGFITMAHGTHPVPPPASARLLADTPVAATPAAITRANVELSTPTGIAILKSLAPEFVAEVPAGTIRHQGLGAGTMDLGAFPNVFRVILLDANPAPGATEAYESDRVVEIVCNIDDDSAEHIAWLAEQLLAQGALDVWLTPAMGKKGRLLTSLSVLATATGWSAHADWLLRNSTTFGLRYRTWDRLKLARRFERRASPSGEITYKVGLTSTGEVLKEKAEFDEQRAQWEQRGGARK
ncbi:MAG: LarC family nickel insertion protein [Verrucomicrobia bacterium]|nr:LarC family nickel insertion protein [Verrucomicrobiota bacterium]